MTKLLIDVVIFLAAALIAVPLAVRLGFGAVLGYLVAGIVIGPWGLKLVTDIDAILHFSELGIVLMMFVIGLEMRVDALWEMRRTIFGYGAMQMTVCAAALSGIFVVLGLPWRIALAGGFGEPLRPFLPPDVGHRLAKPRRDAVDGAILLAGGTLVEDAA